MNCFECALRGDAVAAVATCRHCGEGLCLEHLGEAQSYRVGGTTIGCGHDPRRAVGVVRTQGLPSRVGTEPPVGALR